MKRTETGCVENIGARLRLPSRLTQKPKEVTRRGEIEAGRGVYPVNSGKFRNPGNSNFENWKQAPKFKSAGHKLGATEILTLYGWRFQNRG